MNKRTFISMINQLSKTFLSILPIFFLAFLIFGFNDKVVALITLGAAIIHEMGHLCCIKCPGGKSTSIRGVLSGFRIRPRGKMSYDNLIKVYLAGPLANLFIFVIAVLLSPLIGEICFLISAINLATAIPNLMPIHGYDGYGIIKTLIEKKEIGDWALHILDLTSTAFILFFCFISLYFIDRTGEGYWIFAIFFLSMIKNIKSDLDKQF